MGSTADIIKGNVFNIRQFPRKESRNPCCFKRFNFTGLSHSYQCFAMCSKSSILKATGRS